MPEADDGKITLEMSTSPGRTHRVDRTKYEAMRKALLAVLPGEAPGITVAEAQRALLPLLPQELFPGGAKAGWWMKAAQLDGEAKGTIQRAKGSPVRLFRPAKRG